MLNGIGFIIILACVFGSFIWSGGKMDIVLHALPRLRDETLSATRLALARIDSLSPRERSVFNGLICGWPNKVIASQLELSPRTVEIHRAKMMIKLQVRTLAQALQLAFAAQITLEDAHRDQPPAVDAPQISEASDPFSLRRSASTRRQ